jgi:hypothetical protein
MAAATYSVESLLDNVKLAVNDVDGNWITDAQYNSFIISNIVQTTGTITFEKRGVGYYLAQNYSGNPNILLFDNDTTPFTGEDDNAYAVDAKGTIMVTTGTHSTDSIGVAASVVDFAALMYELLMWLAGHRSMQIAQTFGGDSFTPGDVAAQLTLQASHYLGIRSL